MTRTQQNNEPATPGPATDPHTAPIEAALPEHVLLRVLHEKCMVADDVEPGIEFALQFASLIAASQSLEPNQECPAFVGSEEPLDDDVSAEATDECFDLTDLADELGIASDIEPSKESTEASEAQAVSNEPNASATGDADPHEQSLAAEQQELDAIDACAANEDEQSESTTESDEQALGDMVGDAALESTDSERDDESLTSSETTNGDAHFEEAELGALMAEMGDSGVDADEEQQELQDVFGDPEGAAEQLEAMAAIEEVAKVAAEVDEQTTAEDSAEDNVEHVADDTGDVDTDVAIEVEAEEVVEESAEAATEVEASSASDEAAEAAIEVDESSTVEDSAEPVAEEVVEAAIETVDSDPAESSTESVAEEPIEIPTAADESAATADEGSAAPAPDESAEVDESPAESASVDAADEATEDASTALFEDVATETAPEVDENAFADDGASAFVATPTKTEPEAAIAEPEPVAEPTTEIPTATAPTSPDVAADEEFALTNNSVDKVQDFLGDLKSALVEMANRPQPAVNVEPLVEALQAGFDRSAEQAAQTSTAVASLSEHMTQFGRNIEGGVAKSLDSMQRGPVSHQPAPPSNDSDPTFVSGRSTSQTVVLGSISLIVLGWSILFWIKTGSPKLALGTLIGANAIACCLLLSRRDRS